MRTTETSKSFLKGTILKTTVSLTAKRDHTLVHMIMYIQKQSSRQTVEQSSSHSSEHLTVRKERAEESGRE
jgi:hypothetical protein